MKPRISIIGGGTSGLFLAACLDTTKYDVCIYEKKASLGRKFLVAGDGGFNLTHSETLSSFKQRYTPSRFLDKALEKFSNDDFRSWLEELGIPTFVGSSGRVFPEKGIKPIQVLNRIKTYLIDKGVEFKFNKIFTGWNKEINLIFNDEEIVDSEFVVFSLGGASWKVTGSEGAWLNIFSKKGIKTKPFLSSNCAYKINWNKDFIHKHEGTPLKNISISIDETIQKGEAVITKFGIEGNAIYALSPKIRELLLTGKHAKVFIDFKPMLELNILEKKLTTSKLNTTKTLKEKLKLPKPAIDLLKLNLTKEEYIDSKTLANSIKKFPIDITNLAPIDEAISTTGGIDLSSVDPNFELKVMKNHYCIGEMLDWDAPTGGYLIQACVSSGVYLADYLNKKELS